MKHPYKTDISVLMLFFNRPESLRQVFNEVKKARPARLFLYQDGPRTGDKYNKDMEGIMACRSIVEDIDWDCEVHTNYQEQNYGCDPSGYLSHTWAFSLTDKCIVLEDDVVPSQSFFTFCKEMLDRYEHDERITMVSGFNIDEVTTDINDDYFFTSTFSIWGWASWKRVVSKWDGGYSFTQNDQYMRQIEALVRNRRYRNDFMRMLNSHSSSGKQYFESIFWSHMLMNNGLAIMPKRNMINNVGASNESTHYSELRSLPRALRRIFTMKRYDFTPPIRHPEYVIDHVAYKERLYRTNAWGHPWIKIGRSLEELVLNIRYGNTQHITQSIKKRIMKWCGTYRHS